MKTLDILPELEGYEPGYPSAEAALIDGEIANKTPCPECGHLMEYRPYVNGYAHSYRALAVCPACYECIEF